MKFIFAAVIINLSCVAVSSRLSPVVLVPGDGGNQLEARLVKPDDRTGCPTSSSWYRLWLDVWQLSTDGKLKCWADNIKLIYNRTSQTRYYIHIS